MLGYDIQHCENVLKLVIKLMEAGIGRSFSFSQIEMKNRKTLTCLRNFIDYLSAVPIFCNSSGIELLKESLLSVMRRDTDKYENHISHICEVICYISQIPGLY